MPNLSLSKRAAARTASTPLGHRPLQVALLVVTLLTAIDQTIVATALPAIVSDVGRPGGDGLDLRRLHVGDDGRDADLRAARRPPGTAPALPRLPHRLRGRLSAVRCGHEHDPAGLAARPAGPRRRRGARPVPGRGRRRRGSPRPRPLHGTGGARLRRVERARSPRGRIPDRDGRLALDLLGEHPAGRHSDRPGGPIRAPPDRTARHRAAGRSGLGPLRHRSRSGWSSSPARSDGSCPGAHRWPFWASSRRRSAGCCSSSGCCGTRTRSSRSASCATGSSWWPAASGSRSAPRSSLSSATSPPSSKRCWGCVPPSSGALLLALVLGMMLTTTTTARWTARTGRYRRLPLARLPDQRGGTGVARGPRPVVEHLAHGRRDLRPGGRASAAS